MIFQTFRCSTASEMANDIEVSGRQLKRASSQLSLAKLVSHHVRVSMSSHKLKMFLIFVLWKEMTLSLNRCDLIRN